MKITETKPKYNDSDDDGTTTNTPAIFTSFQWHRQKKNADGWNIDETEQKNDIDHIGLAN